MPNHVTNKISLQIAELLKSSERDIDFNAVIPMAKSLIEPDPQHLEGLAKAAFGLLTKPNENPAGIAGLSIQWEVNSAVENLFKPMPAEEIELLIQAINNLNSYGFAYWYPWAIHNWGTKWNAYNIKKTDDFLTFETAWSCPRPIFRRLSEMHPELEITVEYADEDTGSNCGTITYKDGKLVNEDVSPRWSLLSQEDKKRWCRFALNITDPNDIEDRMREMELES